VYLKVMVPPRPTLASLGNKSASPSAPIIAIVWNIQGRCRTQTQLAAFVWDGTAARTHSTGADI